ncbi:MAG TPA: S41 family peptidase [Stellaceae bacterium]|nr:S41 family peptidase [Stellaceae bacterium]
MTLSRAASAVAFLGLAGCAVPSNWPIIGSDRASLFHDAYAAIGDYYIEPVTPEKLALDGIGNLKSVDTAFSVERTGSAVILRYGLSAVRLDAPEPNDTNGWASLTEAALRAAREQSRAVGALSDDGAEETLIDGSLTALDRFSHYSAPDLARERRAARDGFGGIGVTLNTESGDVRIVEVLPDSPAAAAGLKVDDRIVAIDGADTSSLSGSEVIHRLRGAADSLINLAVTRGGELARLAYAMRRMLVVPPSVTLTEEHDIARLRITSFNQHTAQSLADLLTKAHRDMGVGMRGIILDLRDNPGGLLDQSVDVASQFLDGVPVVSTIGRVPDSIQYFTAPHSAVERLPVAVLVNGGSASAAEIVASALQDTGRAVVVGSSSYGKGTVQNVQRMPNEGELTITWARLVTPAGYILHQHGVVPTICTANLPDDADPIETMRRDGSGPGAELSRPRVSLDEAGWKRLRELCPGQRDDHEIEVRAAERLLSDPALYARALGSPAPTAQRPLSTAGVIH